MTWRNHAAPIVAAIIAEHMGETEKKIRAALRKAYPYGERRHYPYKVWCSEIRYQLGIEAREDGKKHYQHHINDGQLELPL